MRAGPLANRVACTRALSFLLASLCVCLPLPLPLPRLSGNSGTHTRPCKPMAPLSVSRQHGNWRRGSGTAAAQERRGGYAGVVRHGGAAAARERRSCDECTFLQV